MQQHVKVLAILHIILGGLGAVLGFFVMLFFGGLAHFVGMEPDNEIGVGVLNFIGFVAMIVIFVISLPELIAGVGLLSFQPWARILTIIISALELPGFPLHTALAVYGFWVLLSNEGAALFENRGGAVRVG